MHARLKVITSESIAPRRLKYKTWFKILQVFEVKGEKEGIHQLYRFNSMPTLWFLEMIFI